MQTHIDPVSYDDMIQNLHIEKLGGLGEGLRHLDILFRRLRIAGRVIMQEDEAEGFVADRPLHRLFDVDGRLIQPADGNFFVAQAGVSWSLSMGFVPQEPVLHIDKGDKEMLLCLVPETLHEKGGDLLRRAEIF